MLAMYHPTVEQLDSCVRTLAWFSERARKEIKYHTSIEQALKETREQQGKSANNNGKKHQIEDIIEEAYILRVRHKWTYPDLGAKYGYSQEGIRLHLLARYPELRLRNIKHNRIGMEGAQS